MREHKNVPIRIRPYLRKTSVLLERVLFPELKVSVYMSGLLPHRASEIPFKEFIWEASRRRQQK
jgi:hypothetical protein